MCFDNLLSLSLTLYQQERRIFHLFHRQVFCWLDEWFGLTMGDIRKLEDVTKEELDRVGVQTQKKRNPHPKKSF